MPHRARDPGGTGGGGVVLQAVELGLACAFAYWFNTHVLTLVGFVARANVILGGMWAVLATVFVDRDTRTNSATAALSRMAATLVSFVLTMAYLLLLPFNPLGLGLLIALGAVVVTLAGRPGDAVTTGITTGVVMSVAALSPEHAWRLPLLRLWDTLVGVAVGLAAARIGGAVAARLQHSPSSAAPAGPVGGA